MTKGHVDTVGFHMGHSGWYYWHVLWLARKYLFLYRARPDGYWQAANTRSILPVCSLRSSASVLERHPTTIASWSWQPLSVLVWAYVRRVLLATSLLNGLSQGNIPIDTTICLEFIPQVAPLESMRVWVVINFSRIDASCWHYSQSSSLWEW